MKNHTHNNNNITHPERQKHEELNDIDSWTKTKKFIKNENNNDFIFQPIHLIDSLGISLNAKEV